MSSPAVEITDSAAVPQDTSREHAATKLLAAATQEKNLPEKNAAPNPLTPEGQLVFTPLPQLTPAAASAEERKSDAPPPDPKNAYVDAKLVVPNGNTLELNTPQEAEVRPTTGINAKSHGFKLGIIGVTGTDPSIDPQGIKAAQTAGEAAQGLQSTVLAGTLQEIVPQTASLLTDTAGRQTLEVLNGTTNPLRPEVNLSAVRPSDIPQAEAEDPSAPRTKTSIADDLATALPEKTPITNVVRNHQKGGFDQTTDISSPVGSIETHLHAPNLEKVNQLQVLFFDITKYHSKDIPEQLAKLANVFDFNERSARALQLALKEPDPIVQKSIALALAEKQLDQYGVKLDQVIWQKARQEEAEAAKQPKSTEEFVRQKIEQLLAEKAAERRDGKLKRPPVEHAGEGYTEAERKELVSLLQGMISKEDLARNKERVESQKGRLSW